ncbi:hypothetical protein MMC14_010162 [Varicellaria rhodocarpa]|nr:hypothetical protein [Varicellaria rhodocarpa]
MHQSASKSWKLFSQRGENLITGYLTDYQNNTLEYLKLTIPDAEPGLTTNDDGTCDLRDFPCLREISLPFRLLQNPFSPSLFFTLLPASLETLTLRITEEEDLRLRHQLGCLIPDVRRRLPKFRYLTVEKPGPFNEDWRSNYLRLCRAEGIVLETVVFGAVDG